MAHVSLQKPQLRQGASEFVCFLLIHRTGSPAMPLIAQPWQLSFYFFPQSNKQHNLIFCRFKVLGEK
jgi:hypothetical protein